MTSVEKFTLEQDGCFHMMCVRKCHWDFDRFMDILDEIWNAFKMVSLVFFLPFLTNSLVDFGKGRPFLFC